MASDLEDSLNELGQRIVDIGEIYNANQHWKYSREDAKWYYDDQKKWNSPAFQMELRRKAGLNPYGSFTTNSVGAPSPIQSSVPEAIQSMSDHMSQQQQLKLERAAQRLTYKQILLDEKRVDNDTKRADAQAKLIGSQATYQNLVNSLKDLLFPNEVDISNAEVSKILMENGMLGKMLLGYDEKAEADLNQVLASTENLKASANLSDEQRKRINTLLPAEKKQLEANATNAEFDAAIAAAVDQILPDDNSKSTKPLKALFKLALKWFFNRN